VFPPIEEPKFGLDFMDGPDGARTRTSAQGASLTRFKVKAGMQQTHGVKRECGNQDEEVVAKADGTLPIYACSLDTKRGQARFINDAPLSLCVRKERDDADEFERSSSSPAQEQECQVVVLTSPSGRVVIPEAERIAEYQAFGELLRSIPWPLTT